MRIEVAVAAVARLAITALELVVLLTRALRLLAWEIYGVFHILQQKMAVDYSLLYIYY